jgi:hypothetical protein
VGAMTATVASGAWDLLEAPVRDGRLGAAPTGPARSLRQESIDDVQNKLASVIANLELVLEMEANAVVRQRAERALSNAWQASALVATI